MRLFIGNVNVVTKVTIKVSQLSKSDENPKPSHREKATSMSAMARPREVQWRL